MSAQIEIFIVALIAAVPVYLLLRMPWRKHDPREWFLGLFWIFAAGLAVMVFRGGHLPSGNIFAAAAERLRTGWKINFVPLKTIRSFFTVQGTDMYYVNIVGNVVMFAPIGFGLPLLWRRMHNFFLLNLTLVLIPVFVELVQLFINRSVDVDDVLLNFIGGALGALVYAIFRLFSRRLRGLAR